MSSKTSIEWTDATWSPVTGCSKVSDGCRFCYAERLSHRFGRTTKPWTHPHAAENVTLHPERLDKPLRWRKPRRIFVCSMADLFHELVPDEFIDRVFDTIVRCPAHTFQILTKRPARMATYFQTIDRINRLEAFTADDRSAVSLPLPNVWLGTSVEDQRAADERIPHLVETPAAVRFLSCEPLLGPIDLGRWLWSFLPAEPSAYCLNPAGVAADRLHWVIAGGESGGPPDRRLLERCQVGLLLPGDGDCVDGWRPSRASLSWIRSLRDQCEAAGVPFFFKQWGGTTPKQGGRFLDGREWSQFPEVIAS